MFVYETDDSIGQLLKALEDSGQAENTLVIFSADNGPEKYAYKRTETYDHWSAYPLRGLKRDIYEGGHRVPYIVKWPGKVPAGKVSHELVSQIDIMATLAAVIGFDLPKDQAEDSHNLLPLFTGKTAEGPRKAHIHNTFANKFAIREGDWVLVDTPTGYHSGRNDAWEKKYGYTEEKSPARLYNLKEVLGQTNNLISKFPEKVKELRALMKKLKDQGYSSARIK